MTIPANVAQFLGERVLLIVTGTQVGKVYAVGGGSVVELAAISVTAPHDLQGRSFLARHAVKNRTSSLPYIKKQLVRVPFLRDIEKRLLTILRTSTYTSNYIFSPDGLAKHIAELVPRQLANVVRPIIFGNYARFNPLRLIKKIKDQQEKRAKQQFSRS